MQDREPLQDQIVQWVADVGLTTDVGVDLGEGNRWTVLIEGVPFRVMIARKAFEHMHLRMEAHLEVVPEHREAFLAMSKDEQDRFSFDLKLALLAKPTGHRLEADEDGVPSGLVVAYNLFEEPITRGGFFRRVHQIQTTAMVGALYFQKMARFGSWPA